MVSIHSSRLYLSQLLCGACEKQTQFKVSAWDSDVPDEPADEHFAARPPMFQVKERSECCQRYLCHQFRALELGVFPLQAQEDGTIMSQGDQWGERSGWPEGSEPMLIMEKPFRCPLILWCWMPWPFEMRVMRPRAGQEREYLGRALFEWKWWNCFWPCDQHMSVRDSADRPLYELHRPSCCAGGCVNCLAPTCCNRVHRTYIRRAESVGGPAAELVGELHNVWPGWNLRGLCMPNSAADNFVLKFPPDADAQDKSLLMAALFLHNFIYWETRDNQKN